MRIIFYLAEAFLAAYAVRLVSYKFKIPAVSGYVVAGVLLGGSIFIGIPGFDRFLDFWLFSNDALSQLMFINHIALGTIALTIGAELEWKRIKSLGKSIFFIAFFEAFGTFLIVSLTLWFFTGNVSLALILGAVSSATAPAATVSVIQQYKSRGPLTKTILAVVGIDDAISFIIFAFSVAVVKSLLQGRPFDITSGVFIPMMDITAAITLGSFVGVIGARLMKRSPDQESLVFSLAAMIFWITSISAMADISELIANMTCGIIIVNLYPDLKNKIRSVFSAFLPVFYALFFIIGGAHLNLTALPVIWKLALSYFVLRSLGKIIGAYSGAFVSGALPQVKKYIGFTLLPQVGAAIALALIVQQQFGNGAFGETGNYLAETTINVLLITTLLTEFIGPNLTKMSLMKSGEAKE